jgi:hypothetical protein
MEKPAIKASWPPPLDFERASLAWTTKDNSHGRWRVIASTSCWLPPEGEPQHFVLSPRIMAGDVYGTGKLPLDPPYGFQIIASNERHVIIRDFEGDLSSRDTSNDNFEIFSKIVIDTPLLDTARFSPEETPEAMVQAWPLTARLRASKGAVEHVVDFPVLHLNTREPGAFQVETGPVLLPAALIEDTTLTTGGFALAFVFFNRLDRVDLALWGPASAQHSARRGYVHFARWEGVAIELYGGRSHCGPNDRPG